MAPLATYRLQLHREFPFAAAARVVPYLARLGVSHVYCSPILAAAPGSAHGYDVVDHTRLNPELGGEEGWRELVAACHAHGLGIVVDVVPNHMAVPTPESLNQPLWDVLRHGRASAYADWFDVDWSRHGGRILMPVLGRPLDECVRDGELTVDPDAQVLRYYDHELPLAPGTQSLAGDLTALLEAQHYRPAFWRAARDELNYRRFFDVTTLIGLRVEVPEVFAATHALLLALVERGDVDGLRIDHPDGLADPGGYLDRLADATPAGTWIVVEKILEHGEVLPPSWRCAGTTGYDAVTAVTGLFVDTDGAEPMTRLYAGAADANPSYDEVAEDAKRFAVETLFPAEVQRLLRDVDALRAVDAVGAGFPPARLRAAIEELLVAFDVYRAYRGDAASEQRIVEARRRAEDRRPDLRAELRWLTQLLLRQRDLPGTDGFAVRFEQTTGPVMAKGIEDTAFYRYLRLVALNEVGGDPGTFGTGAEAWHEHAARVARDAAHAMTTLSTHDTKRSEDVRARLLALAELPDEWGAAVARWRARAGRPSPVDAATDYLLWQTLVGAFPIGADRLRDYLGKATREAKLHTSWTDPDPAYDEALARHVDAVLGDAELVADVRSWVEDTLAAPGRSNALAQKLVQLTMPGIPDVYQGQELDDFSLVDPDNRRPVDYREREAALDLLAADPAAAPAKLRVVAGALRARRTHPGSFAGGYEPLPVSGPAARHAVAYRRGEDVAVVVTRLPVGLARRGGWDATTVTLPAGTWTDVLTGREATGALADLLAELPVALLTRTAG